MSSETPMSPTSYEPKEALVCPGAPKKPKTQQTELPGTLVPQELLFDVPQQLVFMPQIQPFMPQQLFFGDL
jgi:hypothetical protein